MSLLQDILDRIETEAAHKSAVACAQAARIADMEALINTLNECGCDIKDYPVIHSHYEPNDPRSINTTVCIYRGHYRIRPALNFVCRPFTETRGDWGSNPATILTVEGYQAQIALIGETEQQQEAA